MSIDRLTAYINPSLRLRGADPGSLLDPSLTQDDVDAILRKAGIRAPQLPQPGIGTPPPTTSAPTTSAPSVPSLGDLRDAMTMPVDRDRASQADEVLPPTPSKGTTPPAGSGAPTGQEMMVDPRTGQPVPTNAPDDTTSQDTEDAEFGRRFARLKKYFPDHDYLAEAEQRYGPAPAAPGRLDPKAITIAALIPAIAGVLTGQGTEGFTATSGVLGGLMEGQAQARKDYQTEIDRRRQGVTTLASHLSQTGERSMKDLAYLLSSDIHRERMDRASTERNRLLGQRYASQNAFNERRLAFEQFKWANPSAYQQMEAQIAGIRQREIARHNQIDEALGQGRLDQVRQFQTESLADRQQELGLRRQLVDVARKRVDEMIRTHDASARDAALKSIEGVQRMIVSIDTELGTTSLDPREQGMLQDQRRYYQGVLTELQQRAVHTGVVQQVPTMPRHRVTDFGGFVKHWQEQGKKPVPRDVWDQIDPTDQTELSRRGVTHE